MDKITLIFVDDEPRLCSAWKRLLDTRSDIALIGTATHTDAAFALIAERQPDLLMIDLTMPGDDPIGAIRRVAAEHPSVRCVVYSGVNDANAIHDACEAGAWGFIDKLSEPDDVFVVLKRVHAGEAVFPSIWNPR